MAQFPRGGWLNTSVGSRPKDVCLLHGTLQSTNQRIANLSGQLRRGGILQDISHSVDREIRADIAQRFVLAQLPENVSAFLWLELGEMIKKPPIVTEHY
jgi:hypothetical protein